MWECRQACWHECGLSAGCSGYGAYLLTADRGAFINTLIFPRQVTAWDLVKYWHFTVIPEHTRLSLSYDSDRLPALFALTRIFQLRSFWPENLAGLWGGGYLAYGLTWHCVNAHGLPSHNGRKPQHYRAPSWSWASIEGPISYDKLILAKESNPLIESRIKAECQWTRAGYTGSVIDGSITVAGHLISAYLSIVPSRIEGKLCGLNYSIDLDLSASHIPGEQRIFKQRFYPDVPLAEAIPTALHLDEHILRTEAADQSVLAQREDIQPQSVVHDSLVTTNSTESPHVPRKENLSTPSQVESSEATEPTEPLEMLEQAPDLTQPKSPEVIVNLKPSKFSRLRRLLSTSKRRPRPVQKLEVSEESNI